MFEALFLALCFSFLSCHTNWFQMAHFATKVASCFFKTAAGWLVSRFATTITGHVWFPYRFRPRFPSLNHFVYLAISLSYCYQRCIIPSYFCWLLRHSMLPWVTSWTSALALSTAVTEWPCHWCRTQLHHVSNISPKLQNFAKEQSTDTYVETDSPALWHHLWNLNLCTILDRI